MHAAVQHIARRGAEQLHTFKAEYELPTWGMSLMVFTGLVYLILSFAIEYTFGHLIPALVMVESPQTLLFEPLDTIDPDAPINKTTDSELLLVKQEPITSSFRGTVRYLQSKGGFRARFRGFSMLVVYNFAFNAFVSSIGSLPFIPRGTAALFATVALANLSMAWTHIVISDPSPKPWYRRLPEAKVWKKIAGPTAVLAVAEQATILIPALLTQLYGFQDRMGRKAPGSISGRQATIIGLESFSVLALCAVLGLVLVLPANVMLTRVQASLLSDSEETIVPFDRSFGGKVIPEIVGGTGAVSMLDAWKTFDWNARVRLIKTYVKVFAMQTALTIVFIGIAIAQLFIIIGKSDLKKIIDNPENGGSDPAVPYGATLTYGG